MVYKMTFNIVKSGDEWKLTWELSHTPGLSQGIGAIPGAPGNELSTRAARSTRPWRGPEVHPEQIRPVCAVLESLSPPIPAEARIVCVNGQLLQGIRSNPGPAEGKGHAGGPAELPGGRRYGRTIEAQPVSGEPAPPARKNPRRGRPSRSRSRHRRRTGETGAASGQSRPPSRQEKAAA
ncbi:MAG: hypothetical protein ACLTYN_06415 [Dysosmobacter welbionis]